MKTRLLDMRRLILLVLLVWATSNRSTGFYSRSAETYYISATGSDSNNGNSAATAWRTLAKVNAWTFVPGDTLRFHGGDSFSGSLTNRTLTGAPNAVVTVNSYGNGSATVNGGTGNGIYLVNSEFLTLEGLVVKGSGWTGSGRSIVPTNGGKGIWIQNTRTSGNHLRNITIAHCRVSGFYIGVLLDTTLAHTTGFENATISGNVFSNNLTMGFNLQGYDSNLAGPVDQSRGIYVGYNTIQNNPGDPKMGAGGIHGTLKGEAGGLQVANTTGTTIERNFITDIAGFGGLITGVTYGGSTAIVVTNGRGFRIRANEVARTRCVTHYDASAIDADQDEQDGEIDGNLTYNNIGPAIQVGSYGGKVTSNIRIHHNISYNDVRGNNAGGVSEQGAIRIWGNTDDLKIFNNTIYVNATGTVGIPSAMNFEQVPAKKGDLGRNANVQVVGNIFKTTGGVPIFWAAQKSNKTHLGVACALGNLYDASGGKLVIANDNGSSVMDITSLEAWRAAGFEELNGVRYGTVADAGLLNIAGFAPPPAGFTGSGISISTIKNFDLKPGSAGIGAGIDPWLSKIYIDLGPVSFHGTPARAGARVDVGACPYGVR